MKNWDDVCADMQLNGTPLSALGYCRIAYDEGRQGYDLLKASFEANATETIQLRKKLMDQWQRAETAEQALAKMTTDYNKLCDEARYQGAEICALKEVLRPFANYACDPPCGCNNCRAKELLAEPV